MALTLDIATAQPCTLEECMAQLDAHGFDSAEPESLNHAAQWLKNLAANPDFLADIALETLKTGCQRYAGQNYSPQVILLGTARPGWFLRANIWPSAQEAVVRTSGEAAFVYGIAHDHNFNFLTVGYHGPGYRSYHYEVDPAQIAGFAGETVALRFMETSLLYPGRVMLYRAGRDVHCQYAPESLSVSINLMHSAHEQRWQDQYRYDLAGGRISGVLTRCTGDALARLCLALVPENGRDLVEHLALRHTEDRMRWSAIQAIALAEQDHTRRAEIYHRYAATGCGALSRRCNAAAIAD